MKKYNLNINGKPYDVTVGNIKGGLADVTVNGVRYSVQIGSSEQSKNGGKVVKGFPHIVIPPVEEQGARTIKSPLPGVILGVKVREGEQVRKGQQIAVIEAMKMENDILAEVDGTVTRVFVSKGDSVLEGADILTIE